MSSSPIRRFFNACLATAFLAPATGAFAAMTDYDVKPQEPYWTGTHAVMKGQKGGSEVTLSCGAVRDKSTSMVLPYPDINRMTQSSGDASVTYERTPKGAALITVKNGTMAAIYALINGAQLKGFSGTATTFDDGTVGISGTAVPTEQMPFTIEDFKQAALDMSSLCETKGPPLKWNPARIAHEKSAQSHHLNILEKRLAPFFSEHAMASVPQGTMPAGTPAKTNRQGQQPASVPTSASSGQENADSRRSLTCADLISPEERKALDAQKKKTPKRRLMKTVKYYHFKGL
ncbi:MAG: hypothetical protein PHD48_08975 [Alphaproteobacteria bacterium]|nr:hypothetical protein [Alphaproteobacteria bacterium]